jgi:hypothetical protein
MFLQGLTYTAGAESLMVDSVGKSSTTIRRPAETMNGVINKSKTLRAMEIIWNIERMPKPKMTVFVGDSRWRRQRMVENIKRDCTVDVAVSERTKTSLDVSVSHDNDPASGEPAYDKFYVSQVPPGCSEMSFVEKYFDNPFGPGYYCYYFRISKKQNMEAELK